MVPKVNSKEYWNQRYATGHWEQCHGKLQTTAFAEEQVRRLRVPVSFEGSLLDFGCGLGDAFPVYRERFPRSPLVGVDHSEAAIARCQQDFGHLGTFIRGGIDAVPVVDVIIASNVLEHMPDDTSATDALLSKCSELYVFVPFKEDPLSTEHVNQYHEHSFSSFDPLEAEIFPSRGWSQYGRALWIDVYLKNLLRPLFGRSRVQRRRQVMFRLRGRRGAT